MNASTPKKIGWIPVSSNPQVASCRIRCLNPVRELRRHGLDVAIAAPGTRYGVVVVSKKYDEEALARAAQLRRDGTRVVFDLCDNHFHFPEPTPELRANAERLRTALRMADAVVVSTEAMKDVARSETGVESAAVIGDAVEESYPDLVYSLRERWSARLALRALRQWLERNRAQGMTPLVWFGAAAGPFGPGGMGDLLNLREALEAMHHGGHRVCLTVSSNSRDLYGRLIPDWRLPTHYLDWNGLTFNAALALHAVALIPITPTPFTRCKSGNRVATALWNGLAVVADPIPSYLEFAGTLSLGDWGAGLKRYAAEPASREQDVAKGRELVARRHSIAAIAGQWAAFFESLR